MTEISACCSGCIRNTQINSTAIAGKMKIDGNALIKRKVRISGYDQFSFGSRKTEKKFSAWIDNGHNNFGDENTIILKIELTDAVLISDGKRYEF